MLALILVLSLPFWWLGAVIRVSGLPLHLPLSALQAVCPLTAAVVLTWRAGGPAAVRALLRRVLDPSGLRAHPRALIPAVGLMPLVLALSYGASLVAGVPLPAPRVTLLSTLLLCALFVVAAIGEETGWTGVALTPLVTRVGWFAASLILGTLWALWHVLPWSQVPHAAGWIVWQALFTVAARVVMVQLYRRAGHSVLALVLFHAMIDVSDALYPVNGSYYNPALACGFVSIAAGALFLTGRRRP